MVAMLAGMTVPAAGQPAAPTAPATAPPLLTLSSPVLRSSLDRLNAGWLLPDPLPEFRLKMERPDFAGMRSAADMDFQLRGVELRLPMPGMWVGYDTPADGQSRRATISLRMGF
jgi:hypothetical protein